MANPHTDVTYDEMLARMNPQVGGDFVVACVQEIPDGIEPHTIIREPEGLTIMVPVEQAKALEIADSEVYTLLILGSPGSFATVGLTASVAQMLSARSIPCNVVSGVHHNHIFVPADRTQEAMSALEEMMGQAKAWLDF